MKVRVGLCVLCLALAGLLLAADPPNGGGGKPPKDEPFYAKVDIQGALITVHERWEPMFIVISNRPQQVKLPLIVDKLEGRKDEKFGKSNGQIVRVKGILELRPIATETGGTEDRFTIVAKTVDVVEEEEAPARNEP
jgi:hypothetical protein